MPLGSPLALQYIFIQSLDYKSYINKEIYFCFVYGRGSMPNAQIWSHTYEVFCVMFQSSS